MIGWESPGHTEITYRWIYLVIGGEGFINFFPRLLLKTSPHKPALHLLTLLLSLANSSYFILKMPDPVAAVGKPAGDYWISQSGLIQENKVNVDFFRQKAVYLSIIINIMDQRKVVLLPRVQQILAGLGENMKLARLRRKLSARQLAERANLSRQTISSIEKGQPGVSMGAYLQVLFVLGLEKDLLTVASDDLLGRKLQDSKLLVKSRAPKSFKRKEE